MKLYIVTYYSIIDGAQNRGVNDKAYKTKEAAKDAMNSVYEYWMSEAKDYIENPDFIIRNSGDDYFQIYNLFKPKIFTVDCSIDEVELPDEDKNWLFSVISE